MVFVGLAPFEEKYATLRTDISEHDLKKQLWIGFSHLFTAVVKEKSLPAGKALKYFKTLNN